MPSNILLKHGDCLEVMSTLPDNSVDMILCDLPYGTTACSWDVIIPLDDLWKQYKRLLKKGGCVALTGSQPFTSLLVSSNIKWFKCEWIWKKNAGSNFGSVKYQPMKEHESVLIFGDGKTVYNPIMQDRAPNGLSRVQSIVNYNTKTDVYHDTLNKQVSSKRPDQRYPSSVQLFNRERGLHPTQKPVALMEYLIKTYTNEGEVVLDNCMGSGTTGIACLNTKRRFIGIEKDDNYFNIAKKRIEEHDA